MLTFKSFVEEVEKLDEAAYAGNIGIMELIHFKRKASDDQKRQLDDHIKSKNHDAAWKLVQHVTGVKLHKSVSPTKVSEEKNPDILPKAGAGQDGTDTLVHSYKSDTPGYPEYERKKRIK